MLTTTASLTHLSQSANLGRDSLLFLQAAKEPKGSQMRLLLITAYNIASWAECYERRLFKSVKQVCSETFEVVDPDRGYKMLAEDVSPCPLLLCISRIQPLAGQCSYAAITI